MPAATEKPNIMNMASIKAKIEKRLKSEAGISIEKGQEIDERKYVRTGIVGFDDLLEKGIIKGKSVLVAGSPGTGKTIFCLQTLAYGCQKGEKCIYLSLEESEENLITYMKAFGWNPEKWIEKGQLVIKRIDPYEILKVAEASSKVKMSTDIKRLIPEGFEPDRIIVDSISSIYSAFFGRESLYRFYIEQFFRFLERLKTNSFLITEARHVPKIRGKTDEEEFLADGIIVLYNFREKSRRVRAIEILKLRGTKHENKLIPFNIISGKGLLAYPQEELYASMEKEE